MITISTNRNPVEVQLNGSFASVGLTLRRMTSADFGAAGAAALEIINDAERLENVMFANSLLPEGGAEAWRKMPVTDPITYAAVLTGVGAWIAGVECAARAITRWSGISSDGGVAVAVNRASVEGLMLNEDFAQQVQAAIDQAAVLICPLPTEEAEA